MIYPCKQYDSASIKWLLVAMFVVAASFTVLSQEVDYRAQSLYIYKFTKYIYWPEEKTTGDFIIGVYGNSPIVEELNLMASLKKAGNDQSIVVKEILQDEELLKCHIVYVASSKSRQIKIISELIGMNPVLIVAERDGLASKGADISFMVSDYQLLKFEVNVASLEFHKLTISGELIKLGYKL